MPAKTFMQIFMLPIVMGVLTMIGLVVTLLLEDSWIEMASVGALGIPAIVMMYIYCLRDVFKHQ